MAGGIHVAHTIGNLDNDRGGAQQLLYDLVRHLPNRIETTVFHLYSASYTEAFEEAGATVIDIDARGDLDASSWFDLARHLRHGDFDIVQTHSAVAALWGRPAATLARLPVLSVAHSFRDSQSMKARLPNALTMPLAEHLVGVSPAVIESVCWWERFGLSPEDMSVILNGTDPHEIESAATRVDEAYSTVDGVSPHDSIAGTVGRLTRVKGHDRLIDAWPNVREQCPHAQLVIIGRGRRRDELERKAELSGVGDSITFTGPKSDVYPLMAGFDVGAYPSRSEGFGLAVIETMAAGVPVVLNDIPTFRMLDDDTGPAGLVTNADNTTALSEAVVTLLSDDSQSKRRGAAAAAHVRESFSVTDVASQYVDLYERLVSE